MPLALDVTQMATNTWYPLVTSTSEDYVTITNPNPSTPALIQLASTVATSLSDASGASSTKVPAGPGPVYNVRVKASLAIFVQNTTGAGVLKVIKLAP